MQTIRSLVELTRRLGGGKVALRFSRALAYLLTGHLKRPPAGYVDLRTSQVFRSLHHQSANPKPARQILRRAAPRTGVLGQWVGYGPRALFAAFPHSRAELHVFDMQAPDGYRAEWLRNSAPHYTPLALEPTKIEESFQEGWHDTGYEPLKTPRGASTLELASEAATIINAANLDLLMIYGQERKDYTYCLLDQLDIPCIVNLCNSVDLIHHEKVSYYIFTHPQADYYPQGTRLWNARTQQYFTDKYVYRGNLFYDTRGINLTGSVPGWEAREPLIIYHGALYKLAQSPSLEMTMALLSDDHRLEFILMGRTDGQNWQLHRIEKAARKYDVQGQVHYLGNLIARWDSTGTKVVPDWPIIVSYLRRARLYANPFPCGGGQARFQCYATGVPSVHMGVDFGIVRGWRRHLLEVPAFLVPEGTAYTPTAYARLCRQCLYDASYANGLIQKQLQVARVASNPTAYWEQLLTSYEDWTDARIDGIC